jgi:hypothetical protein
MSQLMIHRKYLMSEIIYFSMCMQNNSMFVLKYGKHACRLMVCQKEVDAGKNVNEDNSKM